MSAAIEAPPVAVTVNIAARLSEAARKLPDKVAILTPDGRSLTFAALEDLAARTAAGLKAEGVGRGTRTLLFVPPSLEFFSLTFALFRLGAVPVLIDPGLGRKGLLGAIREVEPEVMLGVPRAQLARVLFPSAFRSVKRSITVGRRWLWGGPTLQGILQRSPGAEPLAPTRADELAAILFTSGSTGAAKGALYTHGIFDAQVNIIGREWGIGQDEIDLPAFPLFALFSTGLGVTCVIPEMDASRPGAVDPEKIVAAVEAHRPTYSFGSPAFWIRVADHCLARSLRLESLRRVFVAGAPVQPALVQKLSSVLPPGAEVVIPYGATESLPVSWIAGSEILEHTAARTAAGEGICIGRPIAESEVRVIALEDGPIASMRDARLAKPGEIGELTVRGPVTTRGYWRRPEDDRRSKITGEDGVIWHRMGDTGWIDDQGRLWFCGRKSHRVETASGRLFSVCCEAIFNQHPEVRRCALVGVGPKPVIVVEHVSGKVPRDPERLTEELKTLGKNSPLTAEITTLLYYPGTLPVDVRHNAKIRREVLAVWAGQRLGAR